MDPSQITTVLNTFTHISRRSNELHMIKEYTRQNEEQRSAAGQSTLI